MSYRLLPHGRVKYMTQRLRVLLAHLIRETRRVDLMKNKTSDHMSVIIDRALTLSIEIDVLHEGISVEVERLGYVAWTEGGMLSVMRVRDGSIYGMSWLHDRD